MQKWILSKTFTSVSRIWIDKNIHLDKNAVTKLDNNTKSMFYQIDIKNHQEAAVEKINKWVSDKTHGMIKKLLDPGSVNSNTKVVITNAVYFHGTWKDSFDKQFTVKRDFFVTPKEIIKVPMMANTMRLNYYKGNDIGEIIELRYVGDKFSMFIILNNDRKRRIEDGCSSESYTENDEKKNEYISSEIQT